MKTQSGIYSITNILNGKRYIGSTANFAQRWNCHRTRLNRRKHYNPYLQKAWNKYGENFFKFEILEICLPEDLLVIEQYYLDWLEPFKNQGYNIAKFAGFSTRGRHHSVETRNKIRSALKGHQVTIETRTKLSILSSGSKHPNFGKHLSEITKAKIGNFHRGKKLSQEQIEKLRQINIGRPSPKKGQTLPDEVKRKISETVKRQMTPERREQMSQWASAHNLRPPSRLGIKHTEETKTKMATTRQQKRELKIQQDNQTERNRE